MASGRLIILGEDTLDLARDLFAQGFSATRVASECGVSATVINRYRKLGEAGFPAITDKDFWDREKPKPKPPRAPPLTREWYYTEYVTNGKSTTKIASEIGCGDSGVLYWLKIYNIEIRKHNRKYSRPNNKPPTLRAALLDVVSATKRVSGTSDSKLKPLLEAIKKAEKALGNEKRI